MKANKFRLVQRLSIAMGLALSFGNIIAATPSFADQCTLVNGQQVCRVGQPIVSPFTGISQQKQLTYCNAAVGVTKNCILNTKDFPKKDDFRTLPDNSVNPPRGFTVPQK
jgi:hypothetical protein